MTHVNRLSRRTALKVGAAATALPLVHIRTAGAAGKLSVALADSFVPNATEAMRALIERWGERAKVEVQVNFLTTIGDKLMLTQAAEAQAGTGHDLLQFFSYDVATYADRLEPVDDVVVRLIEKHGALSPGIENFAKLGETWRAVPASWGSIYRSCVTRIDLFRRYADLDIPATFPAAAEMGPGYDQWTWDAFLRAAENCFRAGYPFGLQISNCYDAGAWISTLFRSFGAELVDPEGKITVRSDATRAALDYGGRLAKFLPPDVYTWNNASDNRVMIAGKSALIFDPPSPWAGALQDNPAVGAQLWHNPIPAGPQGRYIAFTPGYFGIWNFSRSKSAAKDLIDWLDEREQVEAACVASHGYDIPPFVTMLDFPVWAESEPPKGTLFNYPRRPSHHAMAIEPGGPAPPLIAAQIRNQFVFPKMLARVAQSGVPIEQSIALAEQELEGFMR